jgi:hypothetical protein
MSQKSKSDFRFRCGKDKFKCDANNHCLKSDKSKEWYIKHIKVDNYDKLSEHDQNFRDTYDKFHIECFFYMQSSQPNNSIKLTALSELYIEYAFYREYSSTYIESNIKNYLSIYPVTCYLIKQFDEKDEIKCIVCNKKCECGINTVIPTTPNSYKITNIIKLWYHIECFYFIKASAHLKNYDTLNEVHTRVLEYQLEKIGLQYKSSKTNNINIVLKTKL